MTIRQQINKCIIVFICTLISIGCEMYENSKIPTLGKDYLKVNENDLLTIVEYFKKNPINDEKMIRMRLREKGAYVIFENENEKDITQKLDIPETLIERWRTLDGLYSFQYDIEKKTITFNALSARNENSFDVLLVYYFDENDIICQSCENLVKNKKFNDLKEFKCALDKNWIIWSRD